MRSIVLLAVMTGTAMTGVAAAEDKTPETLGELTARLGAEANRAYRASPFSTLSKDYFATRLPGPLRARSRSTKHGR